MKELSQEEKLDIAVSLEDYHKCFYTFFEMAGVYFDETVPTACVVFTKSKPILKLGEEFWKSLNLRERLFVICHECLHVILRHGIRNGRDVKGATPKLINVAQDITINEMIRDLFKFDRRDIRGWERYCWIDTCFKYPFLIKRNENFIYYLEKLIEEEKEDLPETVDSHGEDGEESDGDGTEQSEENADGDDSTLEELEIEIQKVIESILEDLSPGELDSIKKSVPPGSFPGGLEAIFSAKQKPLKIKFNHILRKLKKTSMKEKLVDVDSFAGEDRRFSGLAKQNVLLPGKAERPKLVKDKLLTAIFMDVSGSCIDYIDTFTKAYLAFYREPDIFDVRTFIFDTKVTEVKPGDKIYIGGGTKFDIIEKKCLELASEYRRYPDCVILITDGEGTEVSPLAPSKWIWLLTDQHVKTYIDSKSQHFLIKNVTFR